RLIGAVPVADAIAYTAFVPPGGPNRVSTPGQFRWVFLKQPTLSHTSLLPDPLRDPRTLDWLRARLTLLYPEERPKSLEIVWSRYRYVVEGTHVTRTVTPLVRLRVPLRG